MIVCLLPLRGFVVKPPLWQCAQQLRQKSDGSSMKRLNHTNKALFGSVTRNAATPKSTDEPPSPNTDAAPPSRNDLSSEMYWLLQHKQSKPATRKNAPASSSASRAMPAAKTKTRPPIDRAPDDDVLRSLLRPIKVPRKRTIKTLAPAKNIPTSLSRFRDTLCTPPVKDLAALVAAPRLLKQSSSDGLQRMLRVPPFHMDGHTFNDGDFVGSAERLDTGDMPSVGAVLQATMPESSRRALQHWKRLKVAELGEQGFLELQKCMLNITLEDVHFLKYFQFCHSSPDGRFEFPFGAPDILLHEAGTGSTFAADRLVEERFVGSGEREFRSRADRSAHRSPYSAVQGYRGLRVESEVSIPRLRTLLNVINMCFHIGMPVASCPSLNGKSPIVRR